jgi:hypothetical protein
MTFCTGLSRPGTTARSAKPDPLYCMTTRNADTLKYVHMHSTPRRTMNKKMLILPLTAALLAACGGAPIPVTLNTLTLGGVTGPLKVEGSAKLAVTATGTDGNPFTGTATFTSSDPNVVSVAADGTLNVRHVSTRPVTLTVTEAGKTASVDVTTYGLDFATGTYNYGGPYLTTEFTTRFIDANGNDLSTATPLTIQGPAGFNNDAPYTNPYPASLKGAATISDFSTAAAIPGKYTATITVGGVTYTKSATLDTQSILPQPKDVTIAPTTQNFMLSGTLPAGTGRVSVFAYSNATKTYVANNAGRIPTVPSTNSWNMPITPGSYFFLFIARSYLGANDAKSGDPFPDQANASNVYSPAINVN